MEPYTAVMIVEGVERANQDTLTEAWQYLIDTGLAWKLEGWFGRMATQLIEDGICHIAEKQT